MTDLKAPYRLRQNRLTEQISRAGLNALALNPGPSLVYLTGLHFHLMERPVVALFTVHKPPFLVIPELEAAKTANLPFQAQVMTYGEDPAQWPEIFRQAALAAGLDGQTVGVEPTGLRFLELRLLEEALPTARFVSAEDSLGALRMCKDANELAAMRKAVDIAQRALLATLPVIKAGVSERAVASELTLQLLRAGSDAQFPFSPIVSGGPNSANPHATPSNRPLQTGDLLVIDWGAIYDGYVSDLTRTFAIGAVEPELEQIARIVLEANAAGQAAGKPGVPASAVDQAARGVIEKAGYGPYFTHRTGHGLGMEGHEAPYMRAGNSLLLEPGMTYTVEPGIYLPGRNGVRIEDDVVVTANSCESLSDLPRELKVL
jgi:Xaa-Pro dipeptidase